MEALSLHDTIAGCDLFKDFTPGEIEGILATGTVKELAAGDILIGYGHANDTLYILIEGDLAIVLENNGAQISIPIQPGECLGEMSLVMGVPTSAFAIARGGCRVLCIPESCFWGQVMTGQKGVRNLMSIMAARLLRSNHSLMEELETRLQYQHLERELETAGKIQASIVPDGDKLLLNRPSVEAYACIHQARVVGGDFYDALMLDDDHLYLAIGDVSGKGMPAALLMMRTVTSLRLLAGNDPGFNDVVPAVNDMLCKNNHDMMFVTLFAGVLNLRTGLLRYVNGSHNPPFLSAAGAPYRLMDLPTSTMIGIRDQTEFCITELQLNPGDSLLLYTDGITEAMNASKEMFDTGQLEKVLNEGRYDTMKALVKALENAVEAFVDDAQQHDDFTILGVRWMG